jgi:hypothetical protein
MAEASDIYGTAFKNGSLTLLARIVGQGGANILLGDISDVHYSVYLLDDQNADGRTAVTGHANVSLTVADVVFAELKTDSQWTVDTVGYLVEYQLTPIEGQVILVRFRVNAI